MNTQTPPFVSGAVPGAGHALEFYFDRGKLAKRGFAEHGDVFAIKLASQPVAVVIGPAHQKQFFNETDKSLSIQEPYQFLRAMFDEVLFLAPHDEYLRQRPFIHEMFKREKMLHYVDVMQEVVQKWIDGLDDSGEMDIVEEIIWLVQEVAGHCFLGSETHQKIGREFWNYYADLSKALDPLLPPHLPLPKFIRRDRAKARMAEILRPIIAERRQNPDKYQDFLQDMISKEDKSGAQISEELVLNMLLGLMLAGHETTAGQAAWTLILLLQHPQHLHTVLEEIERVAPHPTHIDPKRMMQLDFISWAVREVERLRPSVELLMRTVKEDVRFGDYTIPKGWLVQLAPNVGHRLPAYFSEPEQFNPWRYSPQFSEDKKERFLLVGFGGGMHKCTGMNFANNEMIIITALVFRQLELELLTTNPQIQHGMGASRPTSTRVRYCKKAATSATEPSLARSVA